MLSRRSASRSAGQPVQCAATDRGWVKRYSRLQRRRRHNALIAFIESFQSGPCNIMCPVLITIQGAVAAIADAESK